MENMDYNQEIQKEMVVMDDKKKYTQSVGKYTCCISSCRSKEPPFFAFPKDKSLKKLWEDATGILNVRPNSHIKNCVRDLKNELLGLPLKPKLQPGVIPSLHLG